MTAEELSKLTPKEKRIRIAEVCGTLKWSYALPERVLHCDVPDYLSDLNACAEIEKKLTEMQQEVFADNIIRQFPGDRTNGFAWIHATAAQRCDAFLLTI